MIDPAVTPELRTSPKRTLMVLLGGALGVFLGTVLAFALNMIRSSREFAHQSLA